MKHIKTYESFLNESKKINESAEDAETLAADWDVEALTPEDIKNINKGANDLDKWISGAMQKLGPKNQFYLTSKLDIQENSGLKAAGLKWPLFMKILKGGGIQYEERNEGKDIVILFC